MPTSQHRPAVLRDSWKQNGTSSTGRRFLRLLARLSLTAVALGLVGGFLYLLLEPILHVNSHLLLVTGGPVKTRQMEPLDYFANDLAPFQQLKPSLAQATADEVDETVVLASEQSMDALRDRLKGLAVRSRDVLMVYVSAHAVLVNGKVCLVCQNFDPTQDGTGQIPIAQLISAVSESPAATKLIVLESGQTQPDARLGLAVNLLPDLIREEVERRGDDRLWVLSACSALERSQVSGRDQRTLFGYFVATGMAGEADLNGDGIVRLQELFRYVQSNVLGFSQTRNQQSPQTPYLCGTGVEVDPDPVLLSVQPLEISEPSQTPLGIAADEQAATKNDDADPSASGTDEATGKSAVAEVAKEPAVTDPAGGTGQSPAPEDAEAGKVDASAPARPMAATVNLVARIPLSGELQKRIESAWDSAYGSLATAQRDVWDRYFLLQQQGAYGQRPLDYAPVAWRALGELILSYDHQLRQSGPDPALADRLRELSQALESLRNGTPVPASARHPIVDRIVAARPVAVLPAAQVHSMGGWEQAAARGWVEPDPSVDRRIATLDAALLQSDRSALIQWLEMAGPNETFYESWLAAKLNAIQDLNWDLLARAMQLTRQSERVAGSPYANVTWIREQRTMADGVFSRSLASITDQTLPRWEQTARAGFRQAARLYDGIEQQLATIESAHRLRNDLVLRLGYYKRVQLYDSGAPPGLAYRAFQDLVVATLALDQSLRDLSSRNAAGLEADMQASVTAWRRLVDNLFPYGNGPSDSEWKFSGELESMLHLPILEVDLRARLLLRMQNEIALGSYDSSRTPIQEPDGTAGQLDPRSLQGAWRHLEMEVQVAQLAVGSDWSGATDGKRLKGLLDQRAQARDIRAVGPRDGDYWRDACREMDAALASFYQGLPQQVIPILNASPEPEPVELTETSVNRRAAAWRAAFLIDPRDVAGMERPIDATSLARDHCLHWLVEQRRRLDRVAQNQDPNGRRFFATWAARYRQQILQLAPERVLAPVVVDRVQLSVPTQIDLTSGRPQEIEVACKYLGNVPGRILLFIDYNAERLNVSEMGSDSAHDLNGIRSARRQAVQVVELASTGTADADSDWIDEPELEATYLANPGETRRFSFRLTPQPNAADARLLISAAVDQQVVREQTEVVLSARSDWELMVEARQSDVSYGDRKRIDLLPLPNRDADFELFVENRSQRDRQVTLTLIAPQSAMDSGLPVGDLTAAELQAELDALGTIEVLHRTPEWTVPAGSQPMSVPMFPPIDEDSEPPAEPAADAEEAVRIDTRHGMLAVLTETEAGTSRIWRLGFRPQKPERFLKLIASYDLERERIEIRATALQPERLPVDGHQITVEFQNPVSARARTRLRDRVTPNRPVADLFAEIAPAPGRTETVWVHVDDYPRAFAFEVPCWANARQLQPAGNLTRLSVTTPTQGTSFRAPVDTVAVEFQVDVPPGSFNDPTNRIEIGIDADRDRELVQDKTVTFQADRQAEIWFRGLDPDGKLLIGNRVGDFRIELPGTGYRNAIVNILGRVLIDERVVWGNPVEIKLDSLAPEIQTIALAPGTVVTPETELVVTVLADDGEMSGLAGVLIGLADPLGKPSEDLPQVEAEKQGDQSWKAVVPLADLPMGSNRLMIRATDIAGNVSQWYPRQFQIVTAERMAAETATTYRIRGSVIYYGQPVAEATVTLTNVDGEAATIQTDAAGLFSFAELPAGTYDLKATRVIRNKPRFYEGQVLVGEAEGGSPNLILEIE